MDIIEEYRSRWKEWEYINTRDTKENNLSKLEPHEKVS